MSETEIIANFGGIGSCKNIMQELEFDVLSE